MTAPTADPVDGLVTALDGFEPLVAGLTAQQWTRPTPCTDWDVHALLNHVVGGNLLFAGILTGEASWEQVRAQGRAQGAGGRDVLGSNPLAAYRSAAAAVVAAFRRPGVLAEQVTVPFGSVPGAVALHLRSTDVLVHGWDLARATGQVPAFPDDVVVAELAFSRGALAQLPPGRAPFAASHPVGDDVSPIDQLAALLGRDPAWAAPSAGRAPRSVSPLR